jgi:hypothetical protein
MGLTKAYKDYYSNRIKANVHLLEEITPCEFYIPIKQVAYRINLDNNDMYIDFPYNDVIEEQNKDFKYHPRLKGIDDKIFDFFNETCDSSLRYILYEYEYIRDEQKKRPVIRNIYSTIPGYNEANKLEVIKIAFSVIHFNATGTGHYLDDIPFEKSKIKRENYHSLLFVFEKFEVSVALMKEKKLSYLNITFALNYDNNLQDLNLQKKIKHLCYDLTIFGETLLNKPLSDELERIAFQKRFTQNLEEDFKHSLLNLLNTISWKTDTIGDLQLRRGSEFIFLITEHIITEKSGRENVWKDFPDNPADIIKLFIDYFSGDPHSRSRLTYTIKGKTSVKFNSDMKYAYFTIFYNLLHNADKMIFDNEQGENYHIELDMNNTEIITEVTTPMSIDSRIVDFVQDKVTLEQTDLKKNGGIAISKSLAEEFNWKLYLTVSNTKKSNTFGLKI